MANHVRQTKKLKQVVFKKSELTDVQLEDFEREQRLTDLKPQY